MVYRGGLALRHEGLAEEVNGSRRAFFCALLCVLWASALSLAAVRSGSLDGSWDFRTDAETAWRTAQVPLPIQAQFDDLRDFSGVAWYRKRFTAPPFSKKQTVLLKFGAVDYTALVQINGQEAGRHEGGYLPFTLDIGHLLKPGENEILVRVEDPGSQPEIPHGKQNWYVQVSGLWQSVTWEVRPRKRIESFRIIAGADGAFRADVLPLGKARLEILDPSGKVVHSGRLEGKLESPRLWSPASPVLYTARARWDEDVVETRFGFRTFEKRQGKFYLNGEPFYMRGALDQDFYTQGIYTPPSKEFLLEQFRRARQLGLNLLRCHIKVPEPRYLEAADEAGMLVWYEIPNFDQLTDVSRKRAEQTLRGMIERDANHPSLVIVSLFNESWGMDLKQADQRAFLAHFVERARKLAAPLLVVDNSPCCSNFHLDTDIADFHRYNSIPDQAALFDAWVKEYARRPKWLYSPHGDARVRGDEPLVVSEFGNWGLPLLPAKLPWWFSRGFPGRREAISIPAGVEERFRQWKLDEVFGDYAGLARATQWQEWLALKHEIEMIRAEPAIEGYVITEFTDLNWEANGLLDMDRNPKAFGPVSPELQADDVILPGIAPRNAFSGDEIRIPVSFSHYSALPTAGTSVEWQLEGTDQRGSLPLPEIARGELKAVGEITIEIPDLNAPRKLLLKLTAGNLARNSLELFAYPEPPDLEEVYVHDPGKRFKLPDAKPLAQAPAGGVVVATVFDAQLKRYVEAGGKALVLAEHAEALRELPALQIQARRGSPRDGNWMTNFNWYRTSSPLFAGAPGNGLLGWEAFHATPDLVLVDVPTSAAGDVLAGMFIGWIYLPGAYVLQARVGKGAVLISTFRLAANYERDPFSTLLLQNALRYLRSPDFAPQLRL